MKKGQWLRVSENRRLVLDVCARANKIPLFPAEREINLSKVGELRKLASGRVSWTAIFTKAMALTAVRHPQLRQAFFNAPWPRLYQHAFSVASIAVHRSDGEEDRLCWGKISKVEEQSLWDLQSRLDFFKHQPIREAFGKQWSMARLPRPLRRLLWSLALDFSGRERVKTIGTFTVSALGGMRVFNRFHPTVATSSLSYGPIDDDGRCLLTLICDHRVLDGYRAAVCLQELESILENEISAELSAAINDESSAAA